MLVNIDIILKALMKSSHTSCLYIRREQLHLRVLMGTVFEALSFLLCLLAKSIEDEIQPFNDHVKIAKD